MPILDSQLTPRTRTFESPSLLANQVFAEVIDLLERREDAVLCLTTGATPTLLYTLLARHAAHEPRLFARVRVVALDEWAGLPVEHPSGCGTYLRRHVIDPLAIDAQRAILYDPACADPHVECRRVRDAIEAWGGIDLAILGIGTNGHIGLNDPGNNPEGIVHVTTLTDETRHHGMLADHGADATHGMTIGLALLRTLPRAVVMASGRSKAGAIRNALRGEPGMHCPASMLRDADNVNWYLDTEAASLLHRD